MTPFLKSPVQFNKIPESTWALLSTIEVDYVRENPDKKIKLTDEEEQLEKFSKLKEKNKLTKRKKKEMIELTKKIHKKREKEQSNETDKRLRKELQKELKESSALTSETAKNSLKRQIILKVFYIILKVVRNFVVENAFDVILDTLIVFLPKADPQFASDVLGELQHAYSTLDSLESTIKSSIILQKRVLIISVITKISSEYSLITRSQFRFGKHLHNQLFLFIFFELHSNQIPENRRKGVSIQENFGVG